MLRINLGDLHDVTLIQDQASEMLGDATFEHATSTDHEWQTNGWKEHFFTRGNDLWQYIFVVSAHRTPEDFDIEPNKFRIDNGTEYYDWTFIEFTDDSDAIAFKLRYM